MCHTESMDSFRVFDNKDELAAAVAEQTIALLESAIAKYGTAVWVLAGGSTPMTAYKIIADEYRDEIDWSKVSIIIGDERIGDLNGPDNNWHAIDTILLQHISANTFRPQTNQTAEQAARHYNAIIGQLPKTTEGLPRLDVVWLGVGQDGHTLSLFPRHASILPTSNLVIPVHDSPKPPDNRISLALRALRGARTVLVIASGSDKRQAIGDARQATSHLPIALATQVVITHKGHVRWLIDKSAAPTD